jgi:hypothetical protein
VAYDSEFATAPLSYYLPGVPWTGPGGQTGPGPAAVTIGELDIVGDAGQQLVSPLPRGMRLIGIRAVNDYRVVRFRLSPVWYADPLTVLARARQVLSPAPPDPWMMIQRTSA